MPKSAAYEQDPEVARRWLETLDLASISSPERDASDLERIAGLILATATTRHELNEAVNASRRKGRTWTQIAVLFGVSRQAARERFMPVVDR